MLRLLAAALLLTLCSCTAISSRQSVPFPSQDVELTDPGHCRIYVTRNSQMRGALRPVLVFENEREIGVLHSDEYLCWERPPGRKILKLVFDGRGGGKGEAQSLVSIDASAGDILFYTIDLAREGDDPDIMHDYGKPIATALSPSEGRALLEGRDSAPLRD